MGRREGNNRCPSFAQIRVDESGIGWPRSVQLHRKSSRRVRANLSIELERKVFSWCPVHTNFSVNLLETSHGFPRFIGDIRIRESFFLPSTSNSFPFALSIRSPSFRVLRFFVSAGTISRIDIDAKRAMYKIFKILTKQRFNQEARNRSCSRHRSIPNID